MADTVERIAYQESVRGLEMQVRELDELRSRTGLLLAAASVVTSFLGAEVLKQDGMTTLAVLAILAFLGVVACTLVILSPRTGWHFVQSAKKLLEDWTGEDSYGDFAAMQRFLAEHLEDEWDHNHEKLGRLYCLFQIAIGLLGVEIVFLSVGLT